MKHIFIVNSIFSKQKDVDAFCDSVDACCKKLNVEYKIHRTEYAGETRDIAKKYAESGEKVRIYACGGDGTVNEAADGIYGFDNAELSIIPLGTGNDLIRSFGKKEDFANLEKMICAGTVLTDLIKWNDNYCINIMNIGFDRAVVATVERLRRNPLLIKSIAYSIGVAIQFIKLPMEQLKITFDDGTVYTDKFLISLFANAKYYGGGYKAASKAVTDDGLIDVMIIKPVGRLRFISFVGKYKNGTVLDTEIGKKIIIHKRVKSFKLEKDSLFDLCYDGEIKQVKSVTAQIIPKAIRLVVPDAVNINQQSGADTDDDRQPALAGK